MATEKVINMAEKVKIVGLKGAKHLVEGQTYEVHPLQAEGLVKKGWAAYPDKKK